MEFVIYALDKKGDGEARRAARAAHLRCITENAEHFVYGGPMYGEDGVTRGSLMVMRFEDRAALNAYMADDPYFSADVFESVTIWPSRQVIPESSPGLLKAELERQLATDAAATAKS